MGVITQEVRLPTSSGRWLGSERSNGGRLREKKGNGGSEVREVIKQGRCFSFFFLKLFLANSAPAKYVRLDGPRYK